MNIFTALKNRLQNQTPRWFVFLIDIHFTAFSFILSLAIVWQSDWGVGLRSSAIVLSVVTLTYALSFLIFKSYSAIIRHTGLRDIVNVLKATSTALALLLIVLYFIHIPYPDKNFIMVVLHYFFTTTALIFLRILYKYMYARHVQPHKRKKHLLIYEAGSSGVITHNALTADGNMDNVVKAFIDDNVKLYRSRINGVKVIPPSDVTKEMIVKDKIEEIIVSIQNIAIEKLNKIVKNFEGFAVKLRLVPLLKDWIDGRLEATQIQEVHIENLLGRNPIDINKEAFRNEVKDKVVLVTGAAGLVGTEISSHLLNYACKKIILVDQVASDLKKLEESWMSSKIMKGVKVEFIPADIRVDYIVDSLYNRFRLDIVYHADAYNKVLVMEENPYNAITVNIKGTRHLVAAANRYGVEKLVMVAIA